MKKTKHGRLVLVRKLRNRECDLMRIRVGLRPVPPAEVQFQTAAHEAWGLAVEGWVAMQGFFLCQRIIRRLLK